jgi:RecA-family ATPase
VPPHIISASKFLAKEIITMQDINPNYSAQVAELINNIIEPEFSILFTENLMNEPAKENWLIEGLITKESLGMVFGPPANGKSLFVLDIAYCMAAGINWEGKKTESGDVLIIAGEGHYGYKKRLKALEHKHNVIATRLAISDSAAQLDNKDECERVVRSILKSGLNPKLIIIDTLNRNFSGDENSSKDTAAFIANLEQYFKPFGATVIIVHHSGHNTTDRARGSSALRGAMDFEYSVTMDGNKNVTIQNHKAKDFEAGKPIGFSLKQVKLPWLESNGDRMTSVYLEYQGEAIKKTKQIKLSTRDKQIFDSFNDAVNEKGIQPTDEIKQRHKDINTPVIEVSKWKDYAYKVIPVDDKNPRQTFSRARTKFISIGLMMEYDGYIWKLNHNTQ